MTGNSTHWIRFHPSLHNYPFEYMETVLMFPGNLLFSKLTFPLLPAFSRMTWFQVHLQPHHSPLDQLQVLCVLKICLLKLNPRRPWWSGMCRGQQDCPRVLEAQVALSVERALVLEPVGHRFRLNSGSHQPCKEEGYSKYLTTVMAQELTRQL